jgi:two-component system CheB/CheR fusion protein
MISMKNPRPSPAKKKPSSGDGFLIVGIGASAGGISALKTFFENVKTDAGIAYVVILHLSPEHESWLADVLQTVSPLPVTQVRKKVKVEPDHVYVVPPNRSLSMQAGNIVVKPLATDEERRAPVDIFFRTLAQSHGQHAVCVVLSGTGANGSMGLKRIKEAGGAAFVQNPREAEFSEMPRNSIATELVDAILPVKEIPARIAAYRDGLETITIPLEPKDRPDDQQKALREIFTQLKVRTGHDFTNYKRATILRRIERRINVRNLRDLPSYSRLVRSDPEEVQALLKDLLISVTSFFRDQEAFEYLERDIVPHILADRPPDRPVRVWVVGCATGEEAYSIAMIFAEATMKKPDAPPVQIFASDIDENAIAVAREGLYTLNDTVDVPTERLRRFFTLERDAYRIRRELREMTLFASHNILKDPPFAHLDLVCCRNVLIYLNHEAQERVIETLHFALNPGGYLFVGTAESLDGAGDLFAGVNREHHLYQTRRTGRRADLPIPAVANTIDFPDGTRTSLASHQPEPHSPRRISFADLHQQLLESYAPPSVVVNEEYDIVHLSDRAGKYMQIAGGEATMNLLKVIKPELRLDLRTALYRASQRRVPTETGELTVPIDGSVETINIRIRPVFDPNDTARGFILVLFEPSADKQKKAPQKRRTEPAAQHLEHEVERLKTQLRTSVEQFEVQAEELKASNEELRAMNEELRSSTEELETSKEELQSVNEELTTVNQELKIKVDELSQSNSDFRNLIDSSDIATVFVDREFRVKLFSPAARSIFNLLQSDLGRPLFDLTSRLARDDLRSDAEHVLRTLQARQKEVQTVSGETFLMRVTPYRSTDDRITGVVFTFVDISDRLRAEEELRRSEERLRMLIESSTEFALFALTPDGRIEMWNTGAEKVFGWPESEILGKPADVLFVPEDRRSKRPQQEMKTALEHGFASDERWHLRKDGTRFFASGVMAPLTDSHGRHIGFSKIARDMTSKLKADEAFRSNVMLRSLVDAQEDERKRIARDLHDQLGQQITALRLKLEGMKTKYRAEPAMLKLIDETQRHAKKIDDDLSFLVWELRPTALDNLGLRNAMASYVAEWSKNCGIPAEFHTGRLTRKRLTPDIEVNLYRIAQEALNNVLKHAKAKKVDVMLEFGKNDVVLIIEDNGVGFDPKNLAKTKTDGKGLGLLGMRERTILLGGTLAVESSRGKGTAIIARVPIRTINSGGDRRTAGKTKQA